MTHWIFLIQKLKYRFDFSYFLKHNGIMVSHMTVTNVAAVNWYVRAFRMSLPSSSISMFKDTDANFKYNEVLE